MDPLASLEERLAALLEDAAERRTRERSRREEEMREFEPRRMRFEQVAEAWMKELVVPRLETLARALPQACPVERAAGAHSARLKPARSEDYPVDASLTVSIRPDGRYEHAAIDVQPLLVPMLAGHPAPASRVFDLGIADPGAVARFLDDACVAFADSYLRVRDPDSPYQHSALVTDPICGMTFHRSDAYASQEHEGRRWYFCAPACVERFRQAPPGHPLEGGTTS